MRIAFAEAMCDPAQYVPLAQAAEEVGFDAFVIPDSIAYPEVSDSKYPYTPDGSREFLDGAPFIDPFILAATLAAATKTLRFHTFVVKLPIRHPVLVAKQAASVAVMSGNRFSLGVGLSPWPEDFEICDVPWKARGKRMNEMMEMIRGLTTGEFFSYEGDTFQLQSIKMSPTPSEPIPILVGGHSDAALRRAVRLGDGWMHAGGDQSELEAMIRRIKALRKELGVEGRPFEIHAASYLALLPDGLRQLEDLGVTDAVIGFRPPYQADTTTLETKLQSIQMYADTVLSKFRP
ncbi:MAG: TIGR03619 family F420-dependent LLM class oxidoreductase [Polyangiales bacterium]